MQRAREGVLFSRNGRHSTEAARDCPKAVCGCALIHYRGASHQEPSRAR